MKFFCALLLTVNLGPSGVQAACNVNNHHPKNNGYYIEGIAGVDNSQRDTINGKRADKTEWVKNKYYPYGELKKCTGQFCSQQARDVGTNQYVIAHTCARLRFSYAANSGSTVYEMPDLQSFTDCDFSQATLRGAANAGTPHFDYVIEEDHTKKVYYFASKDHCATGTGQKVAVQVSEDYANNALQCKNMGAGSSRIQHCDCNHQLKPTTLIEPCHTSFVNGCLADMPTDRSCCPTGGSYANMKYKNGGTCIPKSKLTDMRKTYTDLKALCQTNQTACNNYQALQSCPSRFNPTKYDPKCNMYKAWKKCENATGTTVEECRTDMNWIVSKKIQAEMNTQASDAMNALPFAWGLLLMMIGALR